MSTSGRSLEGRTVLVSGAGAGLGRQVALAVARAGGRLVLGARDAGRLGALTAELDAVGAEVAADTCDVTRPEDCRHLVRLAEERFGRLDSLVANAYDPGDMTATIEEADLDRWRQVLEVNLFGTLHLVRAGLPALRRSPAGSIVAVNSQIVRRVKPRRGDYAASKAALLTATQVLAAELGPEGIRVNSVVPGRMMGPPLADHLARLAAAEGTTVEQQHTRILGEMRLPYVATDEQVARVVVFLASDLAAGMTGQSVDVNAGETFH